VLEGKTISYKKDSIYLATVVGKPPFGVFHNLILAKIHTRYKAHAKQVMHAFWGVGQMSFVILENFSKENALISQGVCDALDHASPEYAMGGKLGIDATSKSNTPYPTLLNDNALLALLQDK
ncbi:menaquinone biosynthesis decarboxylase, partial [Helicobacter pylori]